MRLTRSLVILTLLLLGSAIEVTWLNPLGLPGATPPLVMVLVIGAAMRRTPNRAALIGFIAGLIVDVMPPSTTPLGVSAFALAILGYAISNMRDLMENSVGLPLLAVAFAGLFVPLSRAVHVAFIGADIGAVEPLWMVLLTSPLYSVMLATIILPTLSWVDAKFSVRNPQIFR